AAARSDWERRRALIKHCDCDALPRGCPPRLPCYEAGFGMCDAIGGYADMCASRWDAIVKAKLPAGTADRTRLKSASFCQVIVGSVTLPPLEGPVAHDIEMESMDVEVELWSCISYIHFSPWKVMFMPATCAGHAGGDQFSATMEPEWTRQRKHFKQMLETYGEDTTYKVQCSEFIDTPAPVNFAPSEQLIRKRGDAIEFWFCPGDQAKLPAFRAKKKRLLDKEQNRWDDEGDGSGGSEGEPVGSELEASEGEPIGALSDSECGGSVCDSSGESQGSAHHAPSSSDWGGDDGEAMPPRLRAATGCRATQRLSLLI
ncbi:unnamed protein product, partial [Prorocentrum cordatum]